MYRPRSAAGSKNVVGKRVIELRKRDKLSQRALADRLQLLGMDIDKNVITRIETGKRFVTDFEIQAFASIFDISYEFLLDGVETVHEET
ncbi:MAG: helix-turn-helix domain-containing protein [Oscillospiraceae bacterium]|nr:helix-turn-helix domain-containing protein [Oscillospiraceae bacterium]